MSKIRFQAGIWFVGLTRPWYASRGAVETAIRVALPVHLGPKIQDFRWHARTQATPGVEPRSDSLYRDNWDEWFSVAYFGEPIEVDRPDALSWVVGVPGDPDALRADPSIAPAPAAPSPRPAPSPALPPGVPTPAAPASDTGQGVVILLLLWALSQHRRAA